MAEWCMAHPWMTFLLAALALIVLDAALTNFFRFMNNILRVICAKKSKEPSRMEELKGGDVE